MSNQEKSGQNFEDYIELRKPMTPQEAAEVLASFHGAPVENVFEAFHKLRDCREEKVQFRDSLVGGYACFVVEGLNQNGDGTWYTYIDRYTGQPLQHVN